MKVQVQFDVGEGPEFLSQEDYTSLGIKLYFNGKRLTALQAVIEQETETKQEEVVAVARDRIAPFLALVEFARGFPLKLGMVHTETLHSESGLSTASASHSADAFLERAPTPLPPAKKLSEVMESSETRLQLIWYNRAKESGWVVDKIRSYYAVIEIEEEQSASGNPIWQEIKWLRDAVSHPMPSNPRIREYLQQWIQADHIDLNSTLHLQFLNAKLEILKREARNILEQKLRWP